MKNFFLILILILNLWLPIGSPVAQGALLDTAPSRVLFVGNSYTAGCEAVVKQLFAASRHRNTVLHFISTGGNTLSGHLATPSTLQAIATGNYDIVVLQEQSQTPAYPGLRNSFLTAAAELDHKIRESGARTVLFQTWGRRDGDSQNPLIAPDYGSMQDLLIEGYAQAAQNTGAITAPVGEAWRVVWKIDPTFAKTLYHSDGSHQSTRGAYLAACVFYLLFTGEDPGGITYTADLPTYVANPLVIAAKESIGWLGKGGAAKSASSTPWEHFRFAAHSQYHLWASYGYPYEAAAYYYFYLIQTSSVYYLYYDLPAPGHYWDRFSWSLFYYYYFLQRGDPASAGTWYHYFQNSAYDYYHAYS